MKAIRVHQFGGVDAMQLGDVAAPPPGPGQVRVAVRAAGVNPVDTYIRSGSHAVKPRLPYTPGTDAGGVVDAVGEGVTTLRAGDRAFVSAFTGFSTGTYAEQVVADASLVHPLADDVSFAQGAALGVPCTTAWRALFQKGGAQPGDVVLVHGASGGVGTAAVQLAAAAGLTVLATAGTSRGRDLALEAGSQHVFDHNAAGYLDDIAGRTGGRGPDLILEMLANANLANDLALIAPRGRIVVVGNRGAIDINPRAIMVKDATVTGMMLLNVTPDEMRVALAAITAALRSQVLRPVVGREFPLAEAARAHETVLQPGAYGKIVLVP